MRWPQRPPTLLRSLTHRGSNPSRLPRMVRFLLFHCMMGVGLGALFAGMLMFINIGGLMDLIAMSEQPALPIAMLIVGCALTFGSAAMAAAVMSLDQDE